LKLGAKLLESSLKRRDICIDGRLGAGHLVLIRRPEVLDLELNVFSRAFQAVDGVEFCLGAFLIPSSFSST
jgi:hypothetical protein